MNVAICIPCLLRGGTEMQSLYLARALVRSSYSVEVVCYFQFDSDVVREFELSGSNVVRLNMKRELGAVRITDRLRKYFSSSRPDVVHVQYMAPGALPVLAARLAGIKRVIATVHQPYTRGHGLHAKILLRSAALLCDYFIAVSEVAESSWFGRNGTFASGDNMGTSRHFTLHNAVDVSRVAMLSSPEVKKTLTVATKLTATFVFGYVGRLRHEKGVDILFEAFGSVCERHSDIKLLVVGDGPDLPQLQVKYDKEGWWRNIVFAGSQAWEDAMKHFSLMDAAVVPSRFEGFGLTAIEAMAASLPVVASNTGGLKEVVENEKSGLLFEEGSVAGLAQAMQRLIEEPGVRSMLSENAKKRAQQFDIALYNESIHDFYKKFERG